MSCFAKSSLSIIISDTLQPWLHNSPRRTMVHFAFSVTFTLYETTGEIYYLPNEALDWYLPWEPCMLDISP